jgi:hypothetical protein
VTFIPSRISIAMTLDLKDMCPALTAEQHLNMPLPVASLVRDHFLSGLAQGQGGSDWAALAKNSRGFGEARIGKSTARFDPRFPRVRVEQRVRCEFWLNVPFPRVCSPQCYEAPSPRSFVARRPFPCGQALVGSPGLCLITPRR